MVRIVLLAGACKQLPACATRQAAPVNMVRSGDSGLTCADLNREIAANNGPIQRLGGQDADVETANVVAYIVWPFAIDLSSKEQIEMRAFLDRNRHLDRLRRQQTCGEG